MRSFLLTLSVFIIFSSCCHKVACVEAIEEVKLVGFTPAEIDTIYIVYIGTPNDTIRTRGNYNTDSSRMYMEYSLPSLLEADVIIPGADRKYRITDATYTTKTSPCGKCLWRSNKVDVLTGCKVNGEASGKDVTLTK